MFFFFLFIIKRQFLQVPPISTQQFPPPQKRRYTLTFNGGKKSKFAVGYCSNYAPYVYLFTIIIIIIIITTTTTFLHILDLLTKYLIDPWRGNKKQEAQILFFLYFTYYYFLHKLLHIPFVKLQKLFDSSMFCKFAPCVYSGVKSNKMRS